MTFQAKGSPASLQVKRGQASWSFFYLVFGSIQAVGIPLIAMADGLPYWQKAIGIIACVTVSLVVLLVPRVQNLLVKLQIWLERPR